MTAKRSSHSIESGQPPPARRTNGQRTTWYLFIMIVRRACGKADSSDGDVDVALKREMGSIRCQSWSWTICQSDKWLVHCVQYGSVWEDHRVGSQSSEHPAGCLLPGLIVAEDIVAISTGKPDFSAGHQSGQDVLLGRPRVVLPSRPVPGDK